MKNYLILFLALVMLNCVHKEKGRAGSLQKGTLVDLSGLDGCTWVIRSSSGEQLIPLNLESFKVNLKNGQAVKYSCTFHDVANTCMAGRTVLLQHLTADH